MNKKSSLFIVLVVLMIAATALAGCAQPTAAPTEKPAAEQPAAVEPTVAPTEAPAAVEPTAAATEAPAEAACTDPFVVDVIYHPTIGGSTALAIADAYNMWDEECLKPRYQRFTSGPPEIAAMVAGRGDIGFIGSGAAWLAFRGDVDILALDNLALTDEIIAKKSSGINTLADLKGKTIATQVGAAGDSLLNLALKKAGLTRDDVTIVNMDNNNLASAILSTGGDGVDAVAGWMPGTTAIMKALGDDGIKLAGNADFPEATFPSTWVANKDFVKNNPEVVQRFINVLTKAQAYRADNMEEACEWASEKSGQAANDLYAQIPTAVWPTGAQLKAFYHDGTFEQILLQLREQQIASGKITADQVPDIKEVLIDAFAKNATAGY